MLGKLLNFFTDLSRVAYKMVAYKKNTCNLLQGFFVGINFLDSDKNLKSNE